MHTCDHTRVDAGAGGEIAAVPTSHKYRQLRIVHVLPFFYPAVQFGGSVAHVAGVSRELARRGHDVRVVTSDLGAGRDVVTQCWSGVDNYFVWRARAGRMGRYAPYILYGMRRPLRDALEYADVVHLHLGLTYVNAIARRAARHFGVPYVYTPHGALCPVRLAMRRLAKWTFVRCIERRVISDAAAVHVLTEKEGDDVRKQGCESRRIVVIPNGVERDRNAAAVRADGGRTFRMSHSVPEEARVVLFLGQLLWVKGIDLLIEAFAMVHRQNKNVYLVCAGPDMGYRGIAEKLVRKYGVEGATRFVGTVDGTEKRQAFCAADLFVLPSYSEGQPLAVLEACGYGVPVLITDRCGIPEVLEYGAGAVEPPVVSRIARAMLNVLGNQACLDSMGANGARMVAERFALDAVAKRLEATYIGVSEGRG